MASVRMTARYGANRYALMEGVSVERLDDGRRRAHPHSIGFGTLRFPSTDAQKEWEDPIANALVNATVPSPEAATGRRRARARPF
jgi:hypothetical protein